MSKEEDDVSCFCSSKKIITQVNCRRVRLLFIIRTFLARRHVFLAVWLQLTVNMIYLRMKHYMGSLPPTPIVSENETDSEYDEESEYSDQLG